MKRKQVWRYYCDYCGRSGCAGGHIKRHEASCTANPDRVCGFCAVTGETQASMPDLIAALNSCGEHWAAGMKALREVANACPACTLAAIRQSGIQKKWLEEAQEGKETPTLGFDFKSEVASFWADNNADRGDGGHW